MPIRFAGLPEFNTLVALEAVVRVGSFVGAARELSVSQVAISKKVQELESWLGTELIRRNRPRIEPTEAAIALAEEIRSGATRIAMRLADIRTESARRNRVVIYASTSFSLFWLSPRLHRFHAANPDIETNLISSVRSDRVDLSSCDLAFVYGDRDFDGFSRTKLFHDRVGPVASPGYLADRPHGSEITELQGDTLLCVANEDPLHPDWDAWISQNKVPLRKTIKRERFFDYGLLINAAIDGLGIAMGWKRHIGSVLESGRLVELDAPEIDSPGSYSLLIRNTREISRPSAVAAFADWVIEECQG